MKVLVTGCAGYIGAVLSRRLLDAGHTVIGVDVLLYENGPAMAELFGPRFAFHRFDARDTSRLLELARKCDAVIPLAAVVGAPACEAWPKEAEQLNRDSIVALMKGLGSFQRVVWPCTNSGYGRCEMATEDSPFEPLSHYARTKAEAEKAVLDHPNAVSLRLSTVMGVSPRMRFDLLVNDWTRRIRDWKHNNGRPLSVYQPEYRRNFVHIQDVAMAFLHALHGDMTGAFNIGNSADNCTKLALARTVREVLGIGEEAVVLGEGEDKDGRDYFISTVKAEEAGFRFHWDLRQAIGEVDMFCSALSPCHLKSFRNA